MQTLFAWMLMGLMLLSTYPLSAWILRGDTSTTLKILLALALATGTLSLIMFWESIFGARFTPTRIALPYFALMLPSALWWLRQPKVLSIKLPTQNRVALLILLAIGAATIFNAAYFPFYRVDTIGIYKPQAQQMLALGGLIPLVGEESLYLTYAPHLPLIYTFAYLASGWENDYLARIIPALLSLGCIPAVYLLAKRIGGESAGWLGALSLVFTPAFARWASSGYVDLPMAFFYVLGAIFALRLWDSRRLTNALLCGALIGLAAWTKNAGLLISVPVLVLWLLWSLVNRRISVLHASITLVSCAAIAGGWYIRNQIGAGFLIPNTAWTDQARHTLNSLFVFVTRPENFAFTGWLILISVALSVIKTVRRRLDAPTHVLILVWTVPFFAAWWLFVSYDPRFLLLFLPPLCALVGVWLSLTWERVPSQMQPRLAIIGTVLALIFALYIVYISVDYKDEILRDPLMSHEEKQAIVRIQ